MNKYPALQQCNIQQSKNWLLKSGKTIRQNYPAPVGFLPEPDFCRIWKSARFRPEPKSGTALIFFRRSYWVKYNGF